MTTSGSTSFSLPIDELIEQAAERIDADPIVGKEARTARRALDLLFIDLQNRGVLLHTLVLEETSVATSVTTVSVPSDTLDTLDVAWRVSGRDIELERIPFGDYLQLNNKAQTGSRPTQYYVDRGRDGTQLYLWPIPTIEGSLAYWRVRQIQDGGDMTNTLDIPKRFYPTIVSGLAYYMALNRGTRMSESRILMLKSAYEEDREKAMEEDRERVKLIIKPIFRKRR